MISIMFLIIGLILVFIGMSFVRRSKNNIDLKGNDGREYFNLISSGASLVKMAGVFLIIIAALLRFMGY